MKKFAYLLILLIITSCGTRKRATDLEKLELEEKSITKIEKISDVSSNIRVVSEYKITRLEPLDPNKESSFTDSNGNVTKFTNSKVIFDSSKKDSSATLRDNSISNKEEIQESKFNSKKKVTAAESSKPNPYLWFGLVVVVCFGLYLWFNKSKK